VTAGRDTRHVEIVSGLTGTEQMWPIHNDSLVDASLSVVPAATGQRMGRR